MTRNILNFLPAAAWTITSYILLTIPGSDLPDTEFLEMIHFDKWVHIGMFGLLVVLWSLPILKKKPSQKIYTIIAVAVICYGILMEFVQKYFTQDRTFDLTDMVADIAGALLGLLFIKLLIRRIDKIAQKNKPL